MFRTLTYLIVGSLLLSSALTPIVVFIIESILTTNPWPFSRVFNRVAMFSVLLVFIMLRKRIDFSVIKQALNGKPIFKPVLLGFILTLLSVFATLYFLIYSTNDLVWSVSLSLEVELKILKYTMAALLVAFIEEVFFRVFIFKGLREVVSFYRAAIVTSFVYACVHFIAPIKTWQYNGPKLLAGVDYLLAVLGQFWQVNILLPLIGLFLVGMVLAFVMEKSNSIYYCIGLHAGWVLGVKLTRFATDPTGDSPLATITGHLEQYHLVALVPAWISIIVVGAIALQLNRLLKTSTT